jgi:predicted dienelactone hydrolase
VLWYVLAERRLFPLWMAIVNGRSAVRHVLLAAVMLLLFGRGPAAAVGFQWATAPDPGDAPLQVAIWYPSADTAANTDIGPFEMQVTMNGAVSGESHPLIVMSHGTGGMALNSYDTAIALAQAGFVVAAVTHTGDNYRDQSTAFTRRNFADRPRHVSRVIDYMLGGWSGRGSIDPGRIGVFGHSAGGATALILAGGVADMDREVVFCRGDTEDWGCRQARQRGLVPTAASVPVTGLEARIKAIVLAAPAVPVVFQPAGLAAVKVPVQLWVGAQDDVVRDAALIRTLLPVAPDYHLIANGGHFAFLSPCSEILERAAPEICKDPAGFDRAAFLATFQQAVIAFYQQQLH